MPNLAEGRILVMYLYVISIHVDTSVQEQPIVIE